jgi:hypothetical protein
MVIGVEASQRPLEDVAEPLTAQEADQTEEGVSNRGGARDRDDRSIDLRDRERKTTSTGPAASSIRRYH